MLRVVLSALVAFIFGLVMVGCGGQLEGSTDENSVLGNGQGAGVSQGDVAEGGDGECDDGDGTAEGSGDGTGEEDCDGEGTPEGAGDGECDEDGDGVPQGDSAAECEAGYEPCACNDGEGGSTAEGGGDQLQVMDPENCDGVPDQLQSKLSVNVDAATAAMGADADKDGCCCLVE